MNTKIYRGVWHKTLSEIFESSPSGLFFGIMPSQVMGWGEVSEYEILEQANIYHYNGSSDEYCANNGLYDREYPEFKEYFSMYSDITKLSQFSKLSKEEQEYIDNNVVKYAGKQFCWYDLWIWYAQLAAKIDLENKGYDGALWSNEDAGNSKQYQIWNLDVIRKTDNYDFDFDDEYEYDYHYHLNDEGEYEYEDEEELYESIGGNRITMDDKVRQDLHNKTLQASSSFTKAFTYLNKVIDILKEQVDEGYANDTRKYIASLLTGPTPEVDVEQALIDMLLDVDEL